MNDYRELKLIANTMRQDIVQMIAKANSGHPGGSLSAVEILTALYFAGVLNQRDKRGDRFLLSKGHAAPVLYAALAEANYIDKSYLDSLRKLGSPLQGHPDKRRLPVLEASTGSLGQGLSLGIGMALAARLDQLNQSIFVLIGDGESNEGQIWEAAMFAGHHKLDNLVAILDFNGFQLDDANEHILDLEPIKDKWQAFRWNVYDIDGHDLETVTKTLEEAKAYRGKPSIVIARTVKGKGVSFMENNNQYHGKAPSEEQLTQAIEELQQARQVIEAYS